MGIFSKSPAEKKLEELTGGFSLSLEYKAILKANGIDLDVGEHIKRQLREEIRLNIVSEEGLQTRLRYLISQNANKEKILEEPEEDEEPSVIIGQPPLKRYEDEVKNLKVEYDAKEKVVVNLIEKSFAPPQITYDKFMDSVKKCSKVFNNQVDSALNIVKLTSSETPRIDTELENKITNMKAIISQIDLSSNEKSNTDVEILFEDMKHLIDSVKKYE